MADTFTYPTNAELQAIAQDLLPRLEANRPIFQILPIRAVEAARVIWEQLDRFTGLQQWRGTNGKPPVVQAVGSNRWAFEPGVYGEHMSLDEEQLKNRRILGDPLRPVDVTDLVMERQQQLLQRRLDRIELIGWTVLGGSFAIANGQGITVHSDAYAIQTFNTTVAWSSHATATPLLDFRTVKLKHRGHSVSFGAGARAYANTTTLNNLLANLNADDLYGRRTAGLGTFNSLPQINELLAGEGLPQLVEYDEGYVDDTGTFVNFIPDGHVRVIGQRPAGQVIGEYHMTRNVNNPGFAPGPYMKVLTFADEVPFRIEVHDGHDGGPALYYPSAVCDMDVTHVGA